MTVKSLPLRGTQVLTLSQALKWSHSKMSDWTLAELIPRVLWATCPSRTIEPAGLLAQMAVETGNFNPLIVQVKNHNYGGLGVTGAGVEGLKFLNPVDGIYACMGHRLAVSKPQTDAWAHSVDPRYSEAFAKYAGKYSLVDNLGKGVWAEDENYALKIYKKFAEIQNTR